jgi:hypothetical protein
MVSLFSTSTSIQNQIVINSQKNWLLLFLHV